MKVCVRLGEGLEPLTVENIGQRDYLSRPAVDFPAEMAPQAGDHRLLGATTAGQRVVGSTYGLVVLDAKTNATVESVNFADLIDASRPDLEFDPFLARGNCMSNGDFGHVYENGGSWLASRYTSYTYLGDGTFKASFSLQGRPGRGEYGLVGARGSTTPERYPESEAETRDPFRANHYFLITFPQA